MNRSLTHRALLGLVAVFALACGEADPEPPPGATPFTLTAEGGTIHGTGPLAGLVLVVPPGAVDGEYDLWMAPPITDRPLPDTGRLVGPEVEFGPDAPPLARAAQLELPFDPAAPVAFDVELDGVKVWRVGPYGWEIAEPSATPSAEGRVIVDVRTLGRFGAGVELE